MTPRRHPRRLRLAREKALCTGYHLPLAVCVLAAAACGSPLGGVPVAGLEGADGSNVVIELDGQAPWYLKACVGERSSLSRTEFRRKCVVPYVLGMWGSEKGLLRPHETIATGAGSPLFQLKGTDDGSRLWYPPALEATAKAQIVESAKKNGLEGKVIAAPIPDPLPSPASPAGEALYRDPGLLWVPNAFVVPGGIFQSMFGWDSAFIIVGLVESARYVLSQDSVGYMDLDAEKIITVSGDDRKALARRLFRIAKGMVDNHAFMIHFYGDHVPNANRAVFLTRSQPPLFTREALAVYQFAQEYPEIAPYEDTLAGLVEIEAPTDFEGWLGREILPEAVAFYRYWRDPDSTIFGEKRNPRVVTVNGHRVSLYHPDGVGPSPEMAFSQLPGNEDYYADVARYFATFPAENPGSRFYDPEGGDPRYHLKQGLYVSDRGVRASGFDLNGRYGDVGQWQGLFAPIALHALLYAMAQDINTFATAAGEPRPIPESELESFARARDELFWVTGPSDAIDGMFTDVWTGTGAQPLEPYLFASSVVPLWAGLASKEQTTAVIRALTRYQTIQQRQVFQVAEHNNTITTEVITETGKQRSCTLKEINGIMRCTGTFKDESLAQHALIAKDNFGMPASLRLTGNQWDWPNSWAPVQHFAAGGLELAGERDLVSQIDRGWLQAVEISFAKTGSIAEKFDATDPARTPTVTAGYSQTQVGFGWTNAFYMEALNRRPAAR